MNSDMTFETYISDSEATSTLGAVIAKHLHGGEVIELLGDLGAGKTTLAQSIVHALGFQGSTPSPTFTVSRVYEVSGGLRVYHFDLYRLQGYDVVTDELHEVMGDPDIITLVEWADAGEAQLLTDRLQITLEVGEKEQDRKITLTGGKRFDDLGKELQGVFSA